MEVVKISEWVRNKNQEEMVNIWVNRRNSDTKEELKEEECTGWELTCWKAALQRRAWESWWMAG